MGRAMTLGSLLLSLLGGAVSGALVTSLFDDGEDPEMRGEASPVPSPPVTPRVGDVLEERPTAALIRQLAPDAGIPVPTRTTMDSERAGSQGEYHARSQEDAIAEFEARLSAHARSSRQVDGARGRELLLERVPNSRAYCALAELGLSQDQLRRGS
ncbi:hypothetical protein [Sandaracinus amylolyticus]|uniref:hypothetical protein n=1 Tax=Sandaracinus amylolyticus TaxID=927083 RepID=UPI001F28A689|nr:hypothetical protein [Sandaracinus amylolyticus]